jgi:hypothetical protein
MRAPDQHWAALVALLPPGTDLAWFRSELECIKANTVTELQRRRSDLRDRVDLCDQIITARLPFAHEAVALRDDCQRRIDLIGVHIRRWKRQQSFELLGLAQRVGADLGYTSKGKSPSSLAFAPMLGQGPAQAKSPPHGPGIDYLQRAAAAIDMPIDLDGGADGARKYLQLWKRMQLRASLRREGRLIANASVMPDGKIVEP